MNQPSWRSSWRPKEISFSRSSSSESSTRETDVFVVTYSDDEKDQAEVRPVDLSSRGSPVNGRVMRNQQGTHDEEEEEEEEDNVDDNDNDGIPLKPQKHATAGENYGIIASPLIESDDGYASDASESDKEYYEEERVLEVITTEAVSTNGKLGPRKRIASFIVRRIKRTPQLDKNDYMSRRTMTALQERMNGISVLPGAMYCIYYILSGMWLWDNIDQVDPAALEQNGDDSMCRMSSWLLQDLYVMPPLPILAIALGITVHAPFSFIYHWHFCTKLPPGKPRFDHWSRKFDQAFIHVISTFIGYGTSGRLDFFVANAVFNAHCVWCTLVSTTATPVKTQSRILLSLIAYTIPFLQRGDTDTFLLVWIVLTAALWLFATYPIRGWSHTAFHAVAAFLPPILLGAAGELAASQEQIIKAAQCAVLAGKL